MSICNCPTVGIDGPLDIKHRQFVANFLKGIAPEGYYGKSGWSLLSLTDMYSSGNSLKEIVGVIPFKGGACSRTMKCCGVCTRMCRHRCVHDCLHRLYMWNQMIENTPEELRNQIPLGIRLAVNQKFESYEHMSVVVSEIINQRRNTMLREYMEHEQLRHTENPYKIDYAPQEEIDPHSGKRRVNPNSGELIYVEWPRSGLCPFCMPDVTVDGRIRRSALRRQYRERFK